MSSDIKLDKDWVVVEGKWARVRTWDLMLDAPDRRRNNTGWRRALVHSGNDELIINYNRDYPGGVKIKGEVQIDSLKVKGEVQIDSLKGKVQVGSLKVGLFDLAYSTESSLVIGDNTATRVIELQGPGLLIEGELRVYKDARFDEAIRTPDVTIAPKRPHGHAGDDPHYDPFSLVERLKDMQRQIERLQNQVKELEQRITNP